MYRLPTISPLEHAAFIAAGLLAYVLVTRIGHQRRHPSAAMAWVVAIVAFPYLSIPLFLLFGTRKFARPLPRAAVRLDGPGIGDDVAPPWATRLLAGLNIGAPTHNAAAVFHLDGAEALRSLLALIDGARQQIDLCTFLLDGDATGRKVAAALAGAARRGVAVRLLLDSIGSLKASRRLLRTLRAAGVQWRWFMPLLHNPMRGRTNLRNHRKLLAVDGRWLWSGGRNIADEYFVGQPGTPAWADLSFTVDGPLAVEAHAIFADDWRMARGRFRRRERVPAAPPPSASDGAPPAGSVVAQLVPSGPDHAGDTLHALLLAAAWQAETRLLAVTPYFVPDEALIEAWCLACRRGVRVTLVVPRRSNHRLADWARERALRALVDAGGTVRLAPAMVHAKAVVVDDRLALCGSANLDGRSLFLNYELTAAFYGRAEVDHLGGWIERLAQQSALHHPVRPAWWRDVIEGMVRVVGFQL